MRINFVIEDFEKELSEYDLKNFQESVKRAKALADNLKVIEHITGKKDNFVDIVCSATNYFDEFEVVVTENNFKDSCPIEILNAKQAKYNEIEEIKGGCIIGVTSADIPNYKLGETVQTYSPIGDTGYWYREL